MLTLHGTRHTLCDGVTRRNFLKIGALGAGLTLADGLRARANTPTRSRPKSAILIILHGGPSQLDTYDLKPDAPAEIRGEFKPIQTNVPGVQISEHFPLQAKMWDKLAVIRSVLPIDTAHTDAGITTGYHEQVNKVEHHPSFGCVVSKMRGSGEVPPYVSLRGTGDEEPGFLGVAHRPFHPKGEAINNLRLANGVNMNRFDERKGLLAGFDTLRRDIDASGSMNGLDEFTTRAFDMVSSGVVRNALDLSKEPQAVRDRYKGLDAFLTARRLVEAGVGFVTLGLGGSVWDTHHDNFNTLKKAMPDLDRALANMIQDLHDRGMENDVVTMALGEFGRTPRITKEAGRDHWGSLMSVLMAGGGYKMGQMIGATDAHGGYAKDNPIRLQRLQSMMYRAVGIDPAATLINQGGRPMYLLDHRDPGGGGG